MDVTVHAQTPKLAPYIATIVAQLAEDLRIPANQVSVKAKTNGQMGFVGREEGIAAQAVALIYTNKVNE